MIFPHVVSRRVRLEPARATDQDLILDAVVRAGFGRGGHEWRSAESTAPVAQFLLQRRVDSGFLGFGTLYDHDPAGYVRLRVILEPHGARFGVGAEVILLLLNYAFATLPIDKVVTQTTEASFGALGLTGDADSSGDTLLDHVYFRGRLWDLHYFDVTRISWESYIDRNVSGVLPPGLSWREASGVIEV